MVKDQYSYWLEVEGTDADRKAVFDQLVAKGVIGENLVPDTAAPAYSRYNVPEKWGTVSEWDEEDLESLLHAVAVAVPEAELLLDAYNETNKLDQYRKWFHGEMFQETRAVTSMPPLREDGNIPFALRHEPLQPPAPVKVYLLCEEHETDGIRENNILACSTDRDALVKLLQAKVAKDETGDIGSEEMGEPDYFYMEVGDYDFISFYIAEQSVLTRDQALDLLQTKEYQDVYTYPDGIRTGLAQVVEEYAAEEHYDRIDSAKVVEDLLNNKNFRGMMKQSWFSKSLFDDGSLLTSARFSCRSFLDDLVEKDPDYLSKLGAIPEFNPPANLKDIVIDAIYDYSRSHHLPVKNAEAQAELFMRDADFRTAVKESLPEVSYLRPNEEAYVKAIVLCTNLVISKLAPEYERSGGDGKKPALRDRIQQLGGTQAASVPTVTPGKEPDQGR